MTAWFLGPVWVDGQPELVKIPTGKPWPVQRHFQRVLPVIDDFGNAVAYRKRCPWCLRWLPASFEHFHASPLSIGLRSECRSCALVYGRTLDRKDPDRYRDRKRAQYEKRKNDPEYKARRNAASRRWQAKKLREDPDWKRRLDREKYWRNRNDPEWWAAQREKARISYRLRQERKGRDLNEIRAGTAKIGGWKHSRDSLPATPLIPFIDRYIANNQGIDEETACGQLGVTVRRVYAWRNGEYDGVSFEYADRILVALDLLWFDVWHEGVEGYEQARRLFEGEEMAA